MANRKLQLMTFSLSSKESTLSLSASSMAFISNVPSPQLSSDELHHLIESKQFWLLSSGLCRLEVIVELEQCHISRLGSRLRFLEYMADAICQCSIWSALGLTVNHLAIHDDPLYDGDPNLYFSIEHPDKSFGLLSPTHIPNVYFQGLEFLLRFHTENRIHSPGDHDTPMSLGLDSATRESNVSCRYTTPEHHYNSDDVATDPWADDHIEIVTASLQQEWKFAAHLVQAALHTTVGVRRPRGLELVKEDDGTLPLLKLAPSIWNAHYFQLVATHAKNFPVITNILTASIQGESPTLRQKGADLLEGGTTSNNIQLLESSINRRLWGLLQTSLEPKLRTRRSIKDQNEILVPNEPYSWSPETTSGSQNPDPGDEEHNIASMGSENNIKPNPPWFLLSNNEEGRDSGMTLDLPEHWCVEYDECGVEVPDHDMDMETMDSILEADYQLAEEAGGNLYNSGGILHEGEHYYYFHNDFDNLEVDYALGDGEYVDHESIAAAGSTYTVEEQREDLPRDADVVWNLEFDESEVLR